MRVLVTGAAGYIGSQMVRQLIAGKIDVVAVDSLEQGHRAAVPTQVPLLVGHTGDAKFLGEAFSRQPIDAVMHFAGYLAAGESVEHPSKYFRNNVAHSLVLLDAMLQFNVKRLVFSSSAAVYGTPIRVPIPEDHPKSPINPYGESKLILENILRWYDAAYSLRSISLRYFNAAGAALDGSSGEDHPDESHLIPRALCAARDATLLQLFGDDYPTRDGSCVRDYIHIIDLCEAHLRALDALEKGHATTAYNVGTGRGYSNQEIAQEVSRVSGVKLETRISPRRPGDPAELVADSFRVREEFGWAPHYSDLETIIGSAWKWHSTHPRGYSDR